MRNRTDYTVAIEQEGVELVEELRRPSSRLLFRVILDISRRSKCRSGGRKWGRHVEIL